MLVRGAASDRGQVSRERQQHDQNNISEYVQGDIRAVATFKKIPVSPIQIGAVAAAALFSLSVSAQDMSRPDFSGAWTTFRNADGRASTMPTGELKLTPEASQAKADFDSVTAGTDISHGNSCVGYGMPGSMLGSGGYPMEIIQRDDQLFVIYEAYNEIRRIYLGDEIRDPQNFFPERNGYSTAHWEGDRLVVDTTRLKTQVDSRYPHSSQATIREVYYLDTPLEDGTRVLAAEMTMTDPLWLEAPYVSTKRWQEMDDYHVMTYECTEPLWYDEMSALYEEAGLEMVQE
jgi:hypothetical protein